MTWFQNKNYPKWLFVAYIVFLAITAINPLHPSDFILEQVMTAIFTIVILGTYKKFPLSHVSYTLIFIYVFFIYYKTFFDYNRSKKCYSVI